MNSPVIVPSNITREQAITDIIESVALQQKALSHILNAEGEKLQKFINSPCILSDTLLEANHSINCVINSITNLEMVLSSKLEIFYCSISQNSDK